MNIDDLVRESLEHGVDSLPKREPDPTRVRTRTRRSATLRIALPALAAAAVIAAVSVVTVDRLDSQGPSPATNDTRAPVYVTYPKTVHIDGNAYTINHPGEDILESTVSLSSGVMYRGSDDYVHLIDRTGTEQRIGGRLSAGAGRNFWTSLTASADGRYAAFSSYENGAFTVNLYDAEAGEIRAKGEIDCAAFAAKGNADCAEIATVADGVVYVTGMARRSWFTVAWDPSLPESEQVYRVTDPGMKVTAAAGKTLLVSSLQMMMADPNRRKEAVREGDPVAYDRNGDPVGDDWSVVLTNMSDMNSVLSPDGRWRFTFSGKEETPSEDTLSAVDVRTGESVELVAPAGDVRVDDDGSSVLVMTNGNNSTDQAIHDCALPSGECRTVVGDIGGNDDLPS